MKNIYKDLGFTDCGNIYEISDPKLGMQLPQRMISSLQRVQPNKILVINEKPIILFFHEDNKILKDEGKQQVFKNCWNFSEAPIIIIENESDFEVYNGFEFIADSKSLDSLSKNNLSYISILNGDYFKELKTKKENKRINKFLLENIKHTREELLKNGLKTYKNIANSLIGRIIFIRYLIDRNVYLNKYNKSLTNKDLQEILKDKVKTYELFEYLKDSFNGDWFPIIHDDKNKVYEKYIVNETHLKSLHKLISGYDYKNKIGSLFDIYDFSIIPIEFISNVYESFIGENEQKKSGAYYTPTFLVDYILKYTVDDYFIKNPDKYNCKVLDPACGSGIFLVEALRKLVTQFQKIKKRAIKDNELKKIVKDNIFGIDKDENAILVSIFSIYLAMLDYQNPKELDKFKFPNLLSSESNPNPNFFTNDFFDMSAEFGRILKSKRLNFIIGNPPYGKGTVSESKYALDFIKHTNIQIGNQDIVQPFLMKVKDFMYKNTKISFIVTSKVLYNLQSKDFRIKHFFNSFKINHILELSSVRKEIFENADVPVSIIFYENGTKQEIKENIIKYISMKPNPFFKTLKVLTISKVDFKNILQSKVLDYDYIWKILVYGSYLDFNFLKRLQEYDKISGIIDNSNEGIMIGGGDKNPALQYKGMPFIETKQMVPFYINPNLTTWNVQYVHRPRTLDVFKSPSLLVSKGIGSNLDLKMGILHYDAVFTNSITSVHCKHVDTLYSIMGILSSDFFKYYTIQTATSIGIEREQNYNEERFSVPYTENAILVKIVKEIEKFYINQNDLLLKDDSLKSLKAELNDIIFKQLKVNSQEYALIDYTSEIVIPWIIQKRYEIPFKKLLFKDQILKDYISIFIEHYSKIYEQNDMYFQADVLWDDYAIGIYFKILDKKPNEIITWTKEKNIQNFLRISEGFTLENLFIQKDIKGFEEEYFYVIKPNEYKNWHKAIGYLDFYEFNDALLRSEV